MIWGLKFENFHNGARCCTATMSFHYNIGHFHVEKGHYQDALQQRRVQRLRQCTPGGLLGSPGRALASHGPQDR